MPGTLLGQKTYGQIAEGSAHAGPAVGHAWAMGGPQKQKSRSR